MFDDNLLESFMNSFYGYGNYAGKYWFIGMEEGGGNSFEEIEKRLTAWDKLGRYELEDIFEYHQEVGVLKYFGNDAKLQSTWSRLIRILLSCQGQEISNEKVKLYQANNLGRKLGDSCLIELLPLPSPSANQWRYAQFSELLSLSSRKNYEKHCFPYRIKHIQERIAHYKPQNVVFYGVKYAVHWQQIANTLFKPIQLDKFQTQLAKNSTTTFVMIPHPTSRGISNTYFEKIGELIRN